MSKSSVKSQLENLQLRTAVAQAAAAGVRLQPNEAAIYSNKSPGHLAIGRCKGKGPKFHLDGTNIYYLKTDLDAYSATCVKRRSVSDRVGRPRKGSKKSRAVRP